MPLPLTRRSILAQTWPIILGQASVPLVGLVDTVVIGRTGDAAALAGVALGSIVITFLFWSFGFLRMGMTGLTAQADGAGDRAEVDALLGRGMVAGLGIGALLFLAQWLLVPIAFALFAGGEDLDAAARGYIAMRFWGAPAALAYYALVGWFYGLGRTRAVLILQIAMNAANIALDILFVWHFDMGAAGVGLGTAIAEWIALAIGIALASPILGAAGRAVLRDTRRLFAGPQLRRLFTVNADIMVRTVALLLLFAWFTNAGARLGAEQLAANLVLDQFIVFAAYVLDAFAFTAEERVGAAVGRGSRCDLLRAIRLTGEFSLGTGILFALGTALFGDAIVALITDQAAVRAAAAPLIWMVALIPLLGMPAWLLDGIFLGATRTTALRNAAIVATALYIAADLLLRPLGATGMWIAMLASYCFRAALLGSALPALIRAVAPRQAAS